MAYNPNDLMPAEAAGLGSGLRVYPSSVQPKTFKLGSGTLAKLCPVQFEDASGHWIPWPGGTSEVNKLLAAATTATDGTFTLTITVGGVEYTTAAIDHDETAANIKVAILAIPGIPLVTGDLVTADVGNGLSDNDGYVTFTWGGEMAEQDVIMSYDGTLITGNDHTFSTTTAGVAGRIDGFVWPDAVVLDADEEVLGQVMLGGRIHAGDLVASPDAVVSAVRAACANKQLRDSGFIFEGLVDFH